MVDDCSEKVGWKIWDVEVKKVFFMFIVGEKEVEIGVVFVWKQGDGDVGFMFVVEFVKYFQEYLD